jgi:uncharacterized protein YbjT (DUF2867 family)
LGSTREEVIIMSEARTIAVVGATGAQGGGLARSILDDPAGGFSVRALTRRPDSEVAKALADAGAEVVRADLDEPESLTQAFEGCQGAFCVTNFWEHFSPERELTQARHQAEAARAAGVEHVIWSTLDDTRAFVPLDDDRMPTLMGRYKVPHFDAKAEANEAFRELGVPTTFLNTVFYWDNFIHFGSGPKRGEDGMLGFVLPMGDAKLPAIAVEDIGRCAHGIFKEGSEMVGRTLGIAGEHLSGAEMAEQMAEALGEPVRHIAMDPADYRKLGFPGAEDMGNMFQFYRDFEEPFRASRSVELARRLNPSLQTFREWLAGNASRIPLD